MGDEPLKVEMELPVFLPGQLRNWDQVRAKAIIASDGTLVVKCYDPEDAERLVDYAKQGILLQVAFDFKWSPEKVKKFDELHNVFLQKHHDIEHLCEVLHDAYEEAAVSAGWETQASSRKPWSEVPEPNKITMRAAVSALVQEMEK